MSPADALVAVLEAQVREVAHLLALVEDEYRALRQGDSAAVLDLMARQAPVVLRMGELEGLRKAEIARLAEGLGVPPATLTLDRLAGLLPAPCPALERARRDLRDGLERLEKGNARNGVLVQRTLGFLDRLLGTVFGTMTGAPAAGYEARGRIQAAPARVALLDREA
jgi:hypothetical protein